MIVVRIVIIHGRVGRGPWTEKEIICSLTKTGTTMITALPETGAASGTGLYMTHRYKNTIDFVKDNEYINRYSL